MAKLPAMSPVESSNVVSLGYDRGLYVSFRNGTTYHYPEAPPETLTAGLAAGSVGRWFQQNIRGVYEGSRVAVDADADAG